MRSGAVVLGAIAGCSFPGGGSSSADGPVVPSADAPVVADGAAVIDGVPPAIDARAVDATQPFVCSTAGLVCVGQPPVMLSCGNPGDCFVGCTNGGQILAVEAAQRCQAWGGRLTPIYSAEELTCVRAGLNQGAVLLGLSQAAGAGAPNESWSWNGDGQDPAYLPWDVGQPDDGSGIELTFEQCAYSMGGGSNSWHDITCTGLFSRFACRYP